MTKEVVKEHMFQIGLKWDLQENKGWITSGVRQPLAFGVPPEFNGTEENWSPEHLLCSALASCYLTTFMHFADLMQVGVDELSATASVKMEKLLRGFEATRFIVQPQVKFTSLPDETTMEQLFSRAKKYCFISNSVKGEVIIDTSRIS